MAEGRLIILSGPSGVGKDTLLDEWIRLDASVERVVACTTRPSRAGEIHGVDYWFKSDAEFEGDIAEGRFLEYKLVYGRYYGTPLSGLQQILSQGKTAVLKIDVQGALTVMPLRPDAQTVFLLPPSMEDLRKRIECRGTEKLADIETRLKNARNEIAQAHLYNHFIVNDDISAAVERLRKLSHL